MDHIRHDVDQRRARPTTLQWRLRAGLIVIALAIVLFDAMVLSGQQGNFPVYDLQPIDPVRLAQQVNELAAKNQNGTNGTQTGKATLAPSNTTSENNLPRGRTIPRTDPRRGFPSTMGNRSNVSNRIPSGLVSNSPASVAPNSTSTSPIVQAAHFDPARGLKRDGGDPTSIAQSRQPTNSGVPLMINPQDRQVPPGVTGARYGLGRESAVERISRMETTIFELERENEELRQLNTGLQSQLKETQDQLMVVIREIQSARKEIVTARNDLEKMRSDLQTLREKVRAAQKEHTDVLQSMGPLLQQLLESDDVGSLPPNPLE